MNFIQAIASGLGNYVNFQRRASRSEYWCWQLFVISMGFAWGLVGALLLGVLGLAQDIRWLQLAFNLAIFLPSLAIGVRRLHDTGHSGWFVLLGWLTIIWLCQRGTPGRNEYGRNPLEPAIEDVF